MNDDVIPTTEPNIPPDGISSGSAPTLINNGSGPQIGTVHGNVGYTFNLPSDMPPEMAASFRQIFIHTQFPVNHAIAWSSLDDTLFNLFVLENETYEDNVFCMPKPCSIKKYTSMPIQDRFRPLSAQNIHDLCRMPCIFVRRNPSYKTGNPYPALLGRLTDIQTQTYNFKFRFEAYQATVGQQLLNDSIQELGLWKANLRNELDVEHWSIKTGNLIQFASSHGISVT